MMSTHLVGIYVFFMVTSIHVYIFEISHNLKINSRFMNFFLGASFLLLRSSLINIKLIKLMFHRLECREE